MPLTLALFVFSPALASGSLEVRSTPREALAIAVDGVPTGKATPAVIDGLSPGAHKVRVTGPCLAGEQSVQIADLKTAKLKVEARPTMGRLSFAPEPVEAAIRVDGDLVGQAPGVAVPVPCGVRAIAVTQEGYIAAAFSVEVGTDELVSVPIRLTPLGRGALSIQVTPADARVYLDGLPLGTGARALESVVAGGHVVRAEMDGYAPAERQLIVDRDTRQDVVLALVPSSAAPPPEVPPAPAAPERPSWWTLPRKVGVPVAVAGVALGAWGGLQFAHTADLYDQYLDRHARWKSDPDIPDRYVTDFADRVLIPSRNRSWAASAGGAVLIGSGLMLTWGL